MNRLLLTLSFALIVAGLSAQLHAQGFLKTNGKAITNGDGDTLILRGMGLGGWMLQEGYMLQTSGFADAQHQLRKKIEDMIGESDTKLFYESWLKYHVRKIDIDSLKSWGFNSVRLPLHYNLFTLPIEEEPVAGQHTWLTKGFELTDSLISWCAQNRMYVILDLHAAPGGQGYEKSISDYDPSKPSLWESQENRDKTVALWQKLAERYSNETWVGGYDLINETNWNMTGNTPLRDLYLEITDSIRRVDQNHILFIEGNWFANDFTGLTPPWDENMVYSPHKYWSTNNRNAIQWVLDIRKTYDIPIYFGEAGENSNVWFRDAIRLFEDHGIGWAWWPMKKIESLAGPLWQPISSGYQILLDYWNGKGPNPGKEAARTTLMNLAEGMKLENCKYQKDVIDAMFRQVNSDEAIPFQVQDIPGVVYSTDFDLGVLGSAYFDTDVANYHVSTGNYTAWNSGWAYRNDAVDIQKTQDTYYSNGFNVGWLATGEWMQYSVNVAASAVYDVEIRVASTGTEGRFHLQSGHADVSKVIPVPNTGDWQNWNTVKVTDVILTPSDQKLRFIVDKGVFNLGSFRFIQKGKTSTLSTEYLSAVTLDDHTIQLNINKPLKPLLPLKSSDFQLRVNGNLITIATLELDSFNTRRITFTTHTQFKSSDKIVVSYSGTELQATDGTLLIPFSLKDVKNKVAKIHLVPGKIEAEDFFYQSGIELESTTDVGGGQNIGYLDKGDYCDYYIQVSEAGTYRVNYRTAAMSEQGAIKLELIDPSGSRSLLHTVSFSSTGGWQNWITTSKTLSLPSGQLHIRMTIEKPLFNINWMDFAFLWPVSVKQDKPIQQFHIYPNPFQDYVMMEGSISEKQDVEIQVFNMLGQQIFTQKLENVDSFRKTVSLVGLPEGIYHIHICLENGTRQYEKLLLTRQ